MAESTELATADIELLAELDRMNDDGRSKPKTDGFKLPILKVSYDPEHRGKFHLNKDGVDYFADKVTLRVLLQSFTWSHRDFESATTICETIEVRNLFTEEPIDTKGTLRCGKPKSKDMDDETRKKWEHIKYTRILRGIVDIGDELKNEPCIMFQSGSANIRKFDEDYVRSGNLKGHYRDHKLELSSEQKKKGATTYFVVHFKPQWNEIQPMDQKTIQTLKILSEQVNNKNGYIREKYTQALKNESIDTTNIEALREVLDNEFDQPNA